MHIVGKLRNAGPTSRYAVTGVEGEHEPGSRGKVLKNLLGIKRSSEMDRTEAHALKRAEDGFVRTYDQSHRFTASDLCAMHKIWLGDIYAWAGRYRSVNVSKGFQFAVSQHIPVLMKDFEEKILHHATPCRFPSRDQVIHALAKVHVELVLIHPFREGNGRLARSLATLMALQAGLPILNFNPLVGETQREVYFAAVRAGMDQRYEPMESLFGQVIQETLKRQG